MTRVEEIENTAELNRMRDRWRAVTRQLEITNAHVGDLINEVKSLRLHGTLRTVGGIPLSGQVIQITCGQHEHQTTTDSDGNWGMDLDGMGR